MGWDWWRGWFKRSGRDREEAQDSKERKQEGGGTRQMVGHRHSVNGGGLQKDG